MDNIHHLINSFANCKAAVVGDAMLDTYIFGDSTRISPEAPVPVVDKKNQMYCLGGAANVALNLKKLGAETTLIGTIGKDSHGERLIELLKEDAIGNGLIAIDKSTTCKMRIFAKKQQVLRLDEEDRSPISNAVAEQILRKVKEGNFNVIILQDYNKGLLSKGLIEEIITYCKANQIFIAVDPKKNFFFEYKGVDLFKPNLKEITEAFNKEAELEELVEELETKIENQCTMVTLAEKGIFIKRKKDTTLSPAYKQEVSDVSGAGDTVISVAAVSMFSGASLEEVGKLCNLAASIVCNKVGVAPITKQDLIENL